MNQVQTRVTNRNLEEETGQKTNNIQSKNRYFKGLDTSREDITKIRSYDIDLIKRDLLLFLHTKKGSRLMFPNFGTTIHEKLFEQYYPGIEDEIRAEVENAISQDPRLELLDTLVEVRENGRSIYIEMICNFKPFEVVDRIFTLFSAEENYGEGFQE